MNNELNAEELFKRAKSNNEIQEVKKGLYIIKDEDMGFLEMSEQMNHMTALRTFAKACEQSESIKSNPEKYSLYFVGTYSSKSGLISPVEPMKLGEATSYAPEKQKQSSEKTPA